MKYLLAAALALFLGATPKPHRPTASETYLKQREIVAKVAALYPGVDVSVVWMPCGGINAAYFPYTQVVVMCAETEAEPAASLGIAAHEAAHGVLEQLASDGDEQSADEVAALAMIDLGYQQELLDLAVWFRSHGPQDHQEGDEHPGNAYRAWELACIASGSDGGPPECVTLYRALRVKWWRRLHDKV